jgi:hypothetical protein
MADRLLRWIKLNALNLDFCGTMSPDLKLGDAAAMAIRLTCKLPPAPARCPRLDLLKAYGKRGSALMA